MKIQMYNNPALYDACTAHKIDDIPFYEHWAKQTNGPILELACGTGRIAKHLIESGFNYTGLDLSSVFIDYCRSNFPNGKFTTGDMCDFNLGQKFDLIFIDADKENYLNYYEACMDLINKNGLIVIDNVLWHGEVIDDTKNDKFTKIIREFNTHIKKDSRVVKNIIPIGDGLTICIKK